MSEKLPTWPRGRKHVSRTQVADLLNFTYDSKFPATTQRPTEKEEWEYPEMSSDEGEHEIPVTSN